jgi:hypothetical protein
MRLCHPAFLERSGRPFHFYSGLPDNTLTKIVINKNAQSVL